MELFFYNHDDKYAVEQIMLMLFPGERPQYPAAPTGARWARVRFSEGETWLTATTLLHMDGAAYRGAARVRRALCADPVGTDRLRRRILKQSFYRAGVQYLGYRPPWGALSGVRPAKLMRAVLDETPDERAALRLFSRRYDVSPERAALALDAARCARRAAAGLETRDVCLYLGVPFCPTRCAYCSFVSQSVEKSLALTEPFTEALLLDIAATGQAARDAGLRPRALYLGGGTPTTLSPAQLERVFSALEAAFDLSACGEITVEAGRPDTITAEKLAVLRAHGVSRVSVNPQTMDDRVLAAIGRRHSAADVLRALALVRAAGDFQVNMDLIAGLPEDSLSGFRDTLDRVLDLGAENLTVHTLSLKKGSRILLEGTRLPPEAEVAEMVALAGDWLRRAGYAPYYLYRQKFMSGGLENVGWCRPGTENLYNICIMEELCSILAMGAGGSTKLLNGAGRLRRCFAPKYPREYIDGIAAVCADKQAIREGTN